jgi:hypothetical protein
MQNILAFAAQLLLSPRTGTSATVKGGFGSERPSPRCRARLSLHEEASGRHPAASVRLVNQYR